MRLPKKVLVLLPWLFLPVALLQAQSPARPFPQHVPYGPDIILPDRFSRQQLDDSVRSFYTVWKHRYIRKGCNPGEYYVWFEGAQKQSVSEAQG
jgi:hypothetical protein